LLACLLVCWLAGWLACLLACLLACDCIYKTTRLQHTDRKTTRLLDSNRSSQPGDPRGRISGQVWSTMNTFLKWSHAWLCLRVLFHEFGSRPNSGPGPVWSNLKPIPVPSQSTPSHPIPHPTPSHPPHLTTPPHPTPPACRYLSATFADMRALSDVASNSFSPA
jgi:hypothetical protein